MKRKRSMEKALVTGAGGFIGSHLCERLIDDGFQVRAFIKYNSRNFWGWLEDSKYRDKFEIFTGDIRDSDSVRCALKDVDYVFHLAALIGIPYSYYSPEAYLETNIKGTLNILQAAKDFGIKKIIQASSSEVYGTAQFVPITEAHPINPQSPYAATKSAADYLALSFHASFNLPVAIVRPFNTYGPRQSARAIIPTIIVQILSGKKKIKLGAIHPTRDFTFVYDIVEGFSLAHHSSNSVGRVVNLGNNSEISVEDLAYLIAKLIGAKIEIEPTEERKRPKDSEVQRLWADNSKAKEILGWNPKYSLEEGLKITIAWFKSYKELYKSEIYNV